MHCYRADYKTVYDGFACHGQGNVTGFGISGDSPAGILKQAPSVLVHKSPRQGEDSTSSANEANTNNKPTDNDRRILLSLF
jgi:hypothetical protein